MKETVKIIAKNDRYSKYAEVVAEARAYCSQHCKRWTCFPMQGVENEDRVYMVFRFSSGEDAIAFKLKFKEAL